MGIFIEMIIKKRGIISVFQSVTTVLFKFA